MIPRALALALALAAGGTASAEDAGAPARIRVGLDRLQAAGVAPALALALEERVCAALAEDPRLEVVCPSDVEAAAVLARSAALFGECQSDECMRRVDAVKAADQRVSGAVEKGEKGLVLSLQLTTQAGPGRRVVERLPEDPDAMVAKVAGVVKRLFP